MRHGADPGNGGNHEQLRLALCEGFRDHRVVIRIDGHEVYRRAGVTTNAVTLRADAVTVAVPPRVAHVAVTVDPGNLSAAFTLDVSRHRQVAINLIGEGTVSVETYAM